jgi:UDP-glucose 4-epimerase
MKVLITGGAGFIGGTIASACLDRGIEPVVLDDFSAGRRDFVADRLHYEGDIADGALIDRIFAEHPDIHAVIHCAASTVVPESVAQPLRYYENNVGRGILLLEHLVRNGCSRVIFSSSAAIYDVSDDFTVDEDSALKPLSPYANSKAVFEGMLADAAVAGQLRTIALRYFNPIGADPQLRTGLQVPIPTHALGQIVRAWRSGAPFTITGVDWPTRDGSGIRDYVHVWDLATAHVDALERFDEVVTTEEPARAINLGTGHGTTVKELVAAFERVTGDTLEVIEGASRPGDSAGAYTRSTRAKELLGWRAQYDVDAGIRDSLAWAEEFARRTAG